jgi:hypothetical protein
VSGGGVKPHPTDIGFFPICVEFSLCTSLPAQAGAPAPCPTSPREGIRRPIVFKCDTRALTGAGTAGCDALPRSGMAQAVLHWNA